VLTLPRTKPVFKCATSRLQLPHEYRLAIPGKGMKKYMCWNI
jgi:hypothetical protein